MRLFQNRLKAESGRTLLEMLGVLSIISVLTIGGLAGYQALTLRFETRTVSETIMRHVVERQHEAMTKKGKTAHAKLDVEGPHGVAFDISNDFINQLVVIKIKAAKPDLIQSLLKSDVLKADAYSIDTPTLTEGASSVVMRFKQFPQTELVADSAITCSVGEECAQCMNEHKPNWDGVQCVCTANSCGEGYICANGECVPCTEVDNYKADGSGMMDEGMVCCPDGYDTAVGGMCCPTDAPYCKEVNYLQSDGGQYIDTEFKANTITTRYETKIVPTNKTTAQGVFGSRHQTAAGDNSSCNIFILTTGGFRLDWVYGNGTSSILPITLGTDYTISITGGNATINGVSYTSSNRLSVNQYYNFYIGNHANGSTSPYSSGFIGKTYYGKLYDNDTLVRDFIPVIDKVGEAGMYDKVEGKMYYNQSTTGHFTAG